MSSLSRTLTRSSAPSLRVRRSAQTSSLFRCSSSSTTYTVPLAPGVLPAYDQALVYLLADQQAKLGQLQAMKDAGEKDVDVLEDLEISAYVNDPAVRWRAKEGLGDLSQPVYRHLAERAFRKEGPLALLLQRITQMSLMPDLLPTINPILELKIKLNGEGGRVVVPGEFVLPVETLQAASLEAQVFHSEKRLYTLLMVDPDVPDEMNHSFTTFAHWIIPNIPLSSTHRTISTDVSTPFLSYIPPHPQQGTPYHRYSFLLFAQSSPSEPISLELDGINEASEIGDRTGINVRAFAERNGLHCEGVSFFRQVWDAQVSSIYQNILKIQEPKFGSTPKINRYVDETGARPQKYRVQ